ncbi:MAG: CBS domain-containing protein [Thermoplasmatota archaeon]
MHVPAPQELSRLRADLMPQKEMAEAIGVDRGQLSRWENGRGEMGYEKIRRYAHVLNLRLAAADVAAYLVERIAHRKSLPELRPSDTVDRAIESMAVHQVGELPILTVRGDDYLGVVSDAAVLEALSNEDLSAALRRPVATLRIEPLDRVRPGDSLQKLAALLASQNLVLVEDRDGLPAGFATRHDLFPLLLGFPGAR